MIITHITIISTCFLCGSAGKESAHSVGDLGLMPGLGRSSGERKGYPLQYSGLENSMDCIVHGVTKSLIWSSNFHFHIHARVYFYQLFFYWIRRGWIKMCILSCPSHLSQDIHFTFPCLIMAKVLNINTEYL